MIILQTLVWWPQNQWEHDANEVAEVATTCLSGDCRDTAQLSNKALLGLTGASKVF